MSASSERGQSIWLGLIGLQTALSIAMAIRVDAISAQCGRRR
jgi:hypothetical protein